MADNNINQDQNPEQDPFARPIRRNNWWLYIFGGIVIAGIIIWFFVNWAYKNRHGEERELRETEMVVPAQTEVDETLPTITVSGDSVPAQINQTTAN